MPEALFEYTPLEYDSETGAFTEEVYDRYFQDGSAMSVLEKLVKEPFDEALKDSPEGSFTLGDISLSKKLTPKNSTSWKSVYEKTKTFLEIRADDSKAQAMADLRLIPGGGYSMNVLQLLEEVSARQQEFTSSLKYPLISGWKRLGPKECVREVQVPERDYRLLTPENALVSQNVRLFISSLKKEVLKPYLDAHKRWHTSQTSYDNGENIPQREESPVIRLRPMGRRKFVLIRLAREEVPQYPVFMNTFLEELKSLPQEGGELPRTYHLTRQQSSLFVNIKRTFARLEELREQNTTIEARYNIEPAYRVD